MDISDWAQILGIECRHFGKINVDCRENSMLASSAEFKGSLSWSNLELDVPLNPQFLVQHFASRPRASQVYVGSKKSNFSRLILDRHFLCGRPIRLRKVVPTVTHLRRVSRKIDSVIIQDRFLLCLLPFHSGISRPFSPLAAFL